MSQPNYSLLRPIFNHMAVELVTLLLAMLVSALIIGGVARLLLFWLPRKERGQICRALAGLGIIPGLWDRSGLSKFDTNAKTASSSSSSESISQRSTVACRKRNRVSCPHPCRVGEV